MEVVKAINFGETDKLIKLLIAVGSHNPQYIDMIKVDKEMYLDKVEVALS